MMNEVYVITGASSDIGMAFLQRLQDRCSMHGEKCEIHAQYFSSKKALREIETKCHNLNMKLYQCDMSDLAAVDTWLAGLQEDGVKPTYILHLAAPKFSYMRLKQLDLGKMQANINVNAGAMALMLKYFLPGMAKQKYGRVVAMLTAYTINVPPKFMCDYVVAKYALLGLIRAAASEYAGKGITINGVSPNMMETKFLSNLDERSIEISREASAMKRNIKLDEVCAALEYLLSAQAGYVNGINMNLSGGDRM